MAAELWRLDGNNFALHVDAEHDKEIRNIKRSRDWYVMATHYKGGQVIALQWRIPEWDYRKAKRIEQRINKDVPNSVESTPTSGEKVG